MSARTDPHPIRDFFIADLIDYAPKDSAEMMERPFFSIAKRKRNKPIHYETPDGKLWIKVNGNPTHGMATIWDADILIWCISRIVAQRDAGKNDLRPTIHTTPYELLKGIARGTSGQDYIELLRAIKRLRTTDGIMSGNILTLDREYFLLTGGIERAIYRVARKHAGSQPHGWTVKMTTLYDKTGSESPLKKFTFRIREMCRADELPRYAMRETATQDGSSAVHFVDRMYAQEAVKERRGADKSQRGREDARAAWLDAQRDPRAFDGAWSAWIEGGYPPGGFAAACADRRANMPSATGTGRTV
jgi:plasmid replication initiation protein